MTGISLAVLSAAVWGTSDFLGGRRTKATSAPAVLLIAHGTGLMALAVLLLYVGVGSVTASAALLGTAAGLAELLGVAAVYRGLAEAPARIVAPVAASAPAVAIAIGVGLGHTPSLATLAALGVVLLGLLGASTTSPSVGAPSSVGRGLRLGALAALGFGSSFAAIDLAVAETSDTGALAATAGVVAAGRVATVGVLLGIAIVRSTTRPGLADAPSAAGIGLLIVAGDVAYASATSSSSPGVAAAVATCHTAVTILLARVVDREEMSPLQVGGITAVVAGVALLALSP